MRSDPEVRSSAVALDANMTDFQTRRIVTADSAAYLEGSAQRAGGPPDRIPYCVAYDVADDQIVAMRAFGALAALMPRLDAAAG